MEQTLIFLIVKKCLMEVQYRSHSQLKMKVHSTQFSILSKWKISNTTVCNFTLALPTSILETYGMTACHIQNQEGEAKIWKLAQSINGISMWLMHVLQKYVNQRMNKVIIKVVILASRNVQQLAPQTVSNALDSLIKNATISVKYYISVRIIVMQQQWLHYVKMETNKL